MNLSQITALLAQTKIQQVSGAVPQLDRGGALRHAGGVARARRYVPPNLVPVGIKRQRADAFIPGYNHKDWGRKKKRKTTKYADDLQRRAHKAFESQHRDEIKDVSARLRKRKRDSE